MSIGPRADSVGSSDFNASRPLPVAASVGYEIHEFLAWEAFLLDYRRYSEWTQLLARDLVYRCPDRLFHQIAGLSPTRSHDRDYQFVVTRAGGARDPQGAGAQTGAFRTRRLVSNLIISPADCAKEFRVISYVLLTGGPEDEPESRLLTAERRDVLRRTSNSFQIARRDLRIGQIAPGTAYRAEFL